MQREPLHDRRRRPWSVERRHVVMFALTVVMLAAATHGQAPTASGPALLIKEHGLGGCCGALAVDDLGSFMVVWDAVFYGPGGRGVGSGGTEPSFLLDPFSQARTADPVDLAIRDDNDFIVVWESTYDGVWGRRYGRDGTPLAEAFLIVDDDDAQAARHPSVVYWPPGNGAVAIWADQDPLDADPDDLAVKVRFIDDHGVGFLPFLVNNHTAGAQDQPAIAVGSAGHFFAVWRSANSPDDADGTSIRARPFTVSGSALPPVPVNAFIAGDQSAPDVAVASDGKAFVVWQGSSAGSDAETSIQGRLLDASGVPQASDVQINEVVAGTQEHPKVAVFDDDAFLVVWRAPDGARGRMISADGSVMGAELVLNESPDRSIRDVDLSIASGGRFVVSWVADSPSYPNALTAQFARRFVRPIFADAFEAGDLSVWDVTVP